MDQLDRLTPKDVQYISRNKYVHISLEYLVSEKKNLKNHTIDFADIVLELDEENDKALYRKAQALKLLRDFSGARETFEKLKSAQAKKGQNVPKDVITGIKDCQEALKDYDKKEKSMYQNMFTN